MSTVTVGAPARSAAGQGNGDVLVVFGITGDLAKVMTFRSLYRLEQRGLLDCPVLGVAVDDWTVDQLVDRAREVDRVVQRLRAGHVLGDRRLIQHA